MLFLRIFAAALAVFLADVAAAAYDDEEAKPFVEAELKLPPYPQDSNLIEFYVSAVTANRFFIDGKSLSVGDDGVVRFALVVLTSGGATNVSYEGIRCNAREVKLYATGRTDRTWSLARLPAWKTIENKPVNRHHAALSRDFFCPDGVPIHSASEGYQALRRGIHPNVERKSDAN